MMDEKLHSFTTMARIFCRAILVLFTLCIASAHADVMTMADGRVFNAEVARVTNEAGKIIFFVRPVNDGELSGDAHPVEMQDINRIEFRTLGEISSLPQGRKATIALTSGRAFDNVTVETFKRTDARSFFRIREVNVAAGGPSFEVNAPQVQRVVLAPIVDTPPPATPTPTPAVTPSPTPVRTPVPQANVAEPEFSGLVPGAVGTSMESPAQGAPTDADLDMNWQTDEQSSSGQHFLQKQLYRFPLIRVSVRLIDLLMFLVIGSTIGGIYLREHTRREKLAELTHQRAFALSLGLIVTAVLVYRVLALVPIFGMILGFIGLFFACRVILMASIEVLEEKAAQILTMFLLIEFSLLMIVCVGMQAVW